MRRLLAALVAVLLLVACGPTAGTVTDKARRDAYPQPVLVGKQIVLIWQPEQWSLRITAGDESAWHVVDVGTWESVDVGDYVDLEADQ